MEKETTVYESYLTSVYKWGMITLICACICADIVYTTMKLIGLYPTVSWTALILFDFMDLLFAIIAFFLVRSSIKDGWIKETKLKEGKIFAFWVLLIQWNFILYMIPSRTFWGLLFFFIILICFFLDIKMILFFGFSCIVSVFVAWEIMGNVLLPAKDSLYVPDLIICTIAMFLTMIGIGIFIFFMTHMNWIWKQNDKQLEQQKKYYTELLEKDEGMRRFRHDIKKHLSVIDTFCKNGDYEGIQWYIKDLISYVEKHSDICTGNQIADCFLNTAVSELREQGDLNFELTGRFPKNMQIQASDFCVLFANAVENAKEALEQVDGERTLSLIIRNYQERIYITLKNTTIQRNGDTEKSQKREPYHGYGISNMKMVAEKYGGSVKINRLNNEFLVDICL